MVPSQNPSAAPSTVGAPAAAASPAALARRSPPAARGPATAMPSGTLCRAITAASSHPSPAPPAAKAAPITIPSGTLCRAMAAPITTPAKTSPPRFPVGTCRRARAPFSLAVRAKPPSVPAAVRPSCPWVSAWASRSPQTTATITPAAKLKSRLTIRSDFRPSRHAAPPPRPVPPIPAAAVTKIAVSKASIPAPPSGLMVWPRPGKHAA